MKVKTIVPLIALALAAAPQVRSDVALDIQTTNHEGRRPEVQNGRLLIDPTGIRMDDQYPNPRNTAIFRPAAETLVHVDHGRRSFMNLDKASVQAMAAQLDDAMAKMKEAMAGMPPAQRAMMERMAGGLMGGGEEAPAPSEFKVKPTGERETVSGFAARKHEIMNGAEKVGELWVASWKDLGIRKDDLAAFYGMAAFQQDIVKAFQKNPAIARIGQNAFSNFEQVDGFPVMTRMYRDGKLIRETLVKAVTRQKSPAGSFEAPAGYKQQELPAQRGGR